jgi:glycogen debranching enzyme
MKRIIVVAFLFLFLMAPIAVSQPLLRKQVITCAPGDSTTFFYTNKTTAFYYGETCRLNSTAFQGFNVFTREYFEDYLLQFDGNPLNRRTAEAHIYPDRLVRKYSPQQITEEVILLDSLNVLAIKISSQVQGQLAFVPGFAGSRLAQDFEVRWERDFGMLHVGQRVLMNQDKDRKLPAWTAVASRPMATYSPHPLAEQASLANLFVAPAFLPGTMHVTLRDSAFFYVIVGGDSKELMSVRSHVDGNLQRLVRERQNRLEKVLERGHYETDRGDFDHALRWAMLSLDALIMNQQGKGIFAGLPWFNNYWGRDSFISLPGATLVSGNFEDAREILLSYANFQMRDSKDWRDGRIPNRVMPGEIIYNTADGTGWFVRAARDYLNYSGDADFARKIYPIIERAIDGALRHRVDSLGLMTHGDAETWMDAVGPDGPWTPRGNRAVDIQALWFEKLLAGIDIARYADTTRRIANWQKAATILRESFAKRFWNSPGGGLYDHLNIDNSPDHQLRPNQIFALTVPSQPLPTIDQQRSILRQVVTNLVYPYGVASLWQGDEKFHPYHHHEPFYVQDAAYHNGTVWTWLSGPVISALVDTGAESLAFCLMEDAARQILQHGSYGTQSELLDALVHPGESYPRLSGTATQAWNLAEFVRNWNQDFLGIRPRAMNDAFTLIPALPKQINQASFHFAVGQARVDGRYQRQDGDLEVELRLRVPPHAGGFLSFDLLQRGQPGTRWHGRLQQDKTIRLVLRANGMIPSTVSDLRVEKVDEGWRPLDNLAFAVPALRPDLPALLGPQHALLTAAQTRFDTTGATLIVQATDEEGDDRGPRGDYIYPLNPAFAPGIFDLRKVDIWQQADSFLFRLIFRNLSQPGWHPEYGFQLTYGALALDLDGNPKTGSRRIGRNANLSTPESIGFERIIYVGGGLIVADDTGNILAEYLPPREGGTPLGDVQTREIRFALPRSFLINAEMEKHYSQTPSPRLGIAVFTGAQDDHGGAGVGEFRTVLPIASEWNGGGAALNPGSEGSANVYDELVQVPRFTN